MIMKSLEEQITDLQLEVAALKRAAGRLKKLEKEYEVQKAALPQLEKKVDKEYKDLLDIKKKGWTDLFLDREEEKAEQLEKEQEEYYNALLQVKNAKKTLELMEFEMEILQEKASKLNEKALLLQKLKFKQKHTIELKIKKETDKAILVKNRLKIIFHKINQSGKKIKVHLEEILSCLFKMETWLNYDISDEEKAKILDEEYNKIENFLLKQNQELSQYLFEVDKLKELQKDVDEHKKADLEKVVTESTGLKENIALFVEIISNDLSTDPNLQQKLIKLKAKITEIQYNIDQTNKLLQE